MSDYSYCFFFFNDTATTEIYTLSLHDALPISNVPFAVIGILGLTRVARAGAGWERLAFLVLDRKSTRLNSSHLVISYAVFCLKKKITTFRVPLLLTAAYSLGPTAGKLQPSFKS